MGENNTPTALNGCGVKTGTCLCMVRRHHCIKNIYPTLYILRGYYIGHVQRVVDNRIEYVDNRRLMNEGSTLFTQQGLNLHFLSHNFGSWHNNYLLFLFLI